MRRRWGNQRGGALIVVMMVGLVITIGLAGFITSGVLVEARAVEGSLARSRAYWAEMGNFNYALSRISKSKFCSSCLVPNFNVKDTVMAVNLQAYFNELTSENRLFGTPASVSSSGAQPPFSVPIAATQLGYSQAEYPDQPGQVTLRPIAEQTGHPTTSWELRFLARHTL